MQGIANMMVREQIDKMATKSQRLEGDVNSLALDLQKYQDEILELDNWIYLMNLLQNGQYSGTVTEIDKNLKSGASLRACNIELKKELLFQHKMQHDLMEGTSHLLSAMEIEHNEMQFESGANIYNAKAKMLATIKSIEKEVQSLAKKNVVMATKLKRNAVFVQCDKIMMEAEELCKAKRTIMQISKLQHQV